MTEGWLLVNLGSPEGPTTAAVRRYLRAFLMDPRVLDMPWYQRFLLVNGIIAPFRAPKTAKAYQKIWGPSGSPLLDISQKFADALTVQCPGTPLELVMRFGRPQMRTGLLRLQEAGVDHLCVVPLYPQFAKSSTLSAIEAVNAAVRSVRWAVTVEYLQDFYEAPAWINSLAKNIRRAQTDFQADHLLLSYHGLPEHHMKELNKNCFTEGCCSAVGTANRRCYRAQCMASSSTLVTAAQWPVGKWTVSFQSRLGRQPWIKPFSDQIVVEMAKNGVKRLLVTCPSFVADCLETLEEVAIRLRRDFRAAGGEDLRLVPAVNASPEWIQSFPEMMRSKSLTWLSEREALSIL